MLCYELVCCTSCVVRSGNPYDLVLGFLFYMLLVDKFCWHILTSPWPLLYNYFRVWDLPLCKVRRLSILMKISLFKLSMVVSRPLIKH
jgi:hypothetical protein